MIALLELGGRVLARPLEVAEEAGRDLERTGVQLLLLTVSGAMIWGIVVASARGGLQLLYAPLKAPLVLLLPLAVCLPMMRALLDVEGSRSDDRATAAAGLTGMAVTGLLAAGLAPVLWLWLSLDVSYSQAVLGMVASLTFAGMPGFYVITSMLSGGRPKLVALVTSMVLLGLVVGQTGWMLRPFIVMPGADISFVRPVDGDVLSSMGPLMFPSMRRETRQCVDDPCWVGDI